jgi:hypothetical protein
VIVWDYQAMTSAPPQTSQLPGAFWLGGGSGSGKTTVALTVARRLDLRLYPVHGYTYAHARRAQSGRYPLMQAVNGRTPAQRQEGTPADLAELFTTTSVERLTMVLDDLRVLGHGPTVIVEGPQLFRVRPPPAGCRSWKWTAAFRPAPRRPG